MKKEKTLTDFLFGINGLHIILCLVVMFLRKFKIFSAAYVDWGVLAATLVIWLVFANLAALGSRMLKGKNAFSYAFLSLTPIFLITAVSAVLGFFTAEAGSGWAKFFFIGSAVNFYFRPFSALLKYIDFSAYVYYLACMLMLFAVSLIGASLGISAGKKKIRNKKAKASKKQAPAQKQRKSAAVAEEKKESGSERKPRTDAKKLSDEELANETDEDLQKEIERLKQKLKERQKESGSDQA